MPPGKLELDIPLAQIVREQLQGGGFALLDIRAAHGLALNDLPRHHGDPFDRMMIAQARAEGLPLVRTSAFTTRGAPGPHGTCRAALRCRS